MDALAPTLPSLTKRMRMGLLLGGLLSLATCAPIVIYEHILWTRDQYTGFIKSGTGHLSLAGIWHAAFASVEMAVIVWFFGISLVWVRDCQRLPRRPLLHLWCIFWLYAFLCVPDYLIKRIHLMPREMGLSDLLALCPVVLASGAYLVLRYLSSRQTLAEQAAAVSA